MYKHELMKSAVNQAEIARISGLSRTAVSFALNPRLQSRLNPDTRDRILMTAKQLGYRPHRHAQLMRGKKSGVIGMIKPTHAIQAGSERSFHAAMGIYKAGYHLTANEILWSDEGFKLGVDAMLDAQVEGVLLVGIASEASPTELSRLRRANIPMVSLTGSQHPGIPHVIGDHRQGMTDLTNHVLSLGYRNIAFVTTLAERDGENSATSASHERLIGFQGAVAAAGLGEMEARVIRHPNVSGSFDSFLPGRLVMQRILESGDRPQALLFSNDDLAIGALAVCAEQGVRVPADMAITGFDNTTVGQHVWPPLTTVAQPNQAVALKAVELLLKQVRGETLSASEATVRMPCQVVVRQSCGARPHKEEKST